MMSMDAITNGRASNIANFTDTSGNPSAAKVYRAARMHPLPAEGLVRVLRLVAAGVASQEQYHSAYGLAKAFLGDGSGDSRRHSPRRQQRGPSLSRSSNRVLQGTSRSPSKGYRKDDTPDACALPDFASSSLVEAGGNFAMPTDAATDRALFRRQRNGLQLPHQRRSGATSITNSCDADTTNELRVGALPRHLSKSKKVASRPWLARSRRRMWPARTPS